MEENFCVGALEQALRCYSSPEIFNTDQDMDNILVEGLWLTVRYEDIYARGYESFEGAIKGLRKYFGLYHNERRHQFFRVRKSAEFYWSISESREAA